MESKLTLKINEEVIKLAKDYAKDNNTSLSKMTENYFKTIIKKEESNQPKITGVVAELAGILKDKDVDYQRDSYTDYLDEKYS